MTAPDQVGERLRRLRSFLIGWAFLFCLAPTSPAQETGTTIQVFWKAAVSVPLAGVTSALVIDEDICNVQVQDGNLQITGLNRGETVVFAWVGSRRSTLRVLVAERPDTRPRPRLTNAQLEAIGHGDFDSTVLITGLPGMGTSALFQQQIDWSQHTPDASFSVRAQTQSSTVAGSPRFNLTSGSLQYSHENLSVQALDFLFVPGGLDASLTPSPTYVPIVLRGLDVGFNHGHNHFEAFAGSSVPGYYLSLSGTRSTAGVSWTRRQSERLYLHATAGTVSAQRFHGMTNPERQLSVYATTGFAFRWTPKWSVQGSGGASTEGAMLQGGAAYSGGRLNLYANGGSAASSFPLQQLQVVFAGNRSFSAGGDHRLNQNISLGGYFQRSSSAATALMPARTTGTYFSPNVSWRIARNQQLSATYAFSEIRQTPALQDLRNERLTVLLNSTLPRQASNSAELTLGGLHSRDELHSEANLGFRDTLTVPTHIGVINVGVQHARTDPSLAGRLQSQLQLLPPELQQQFLLNPVGFLQSVSLPAEMRLLLQSMQPSSTEGFASLQMRLSHRLNLSPSFRYIHDDGLATSEHNSSLGYTLVYQVTPGLQLHSSLSTVRILDVRRGQLSRSSAFTIGLRKSLTGAPALLAMGAEVRTIRGRVCVDSAVEGRCAPSDPGLAGIKVELDGDRSVVTDRDGRFAFTRLKAREHRVWINLQQFATPVRVTTPNEAFVDAAASASAEVNFGVVNFSRIMGTVFNDYALEGVRQPDAPGLKGVRLLLHSGTFEKAILSDGAGNYELTDIPPGMYDLTVDAATVPADFVTSASPSPLKVDPTITLVRDVGLRALRSVAGSVTLKRTRRAAGEGTAEVVLEPLQGVTVNIGGKEVQTDEHGEFLIRDLPAGDLTLTLVPKASLPSGMRLPSGSFRMPKEPTQVRDVKIVISNPELIDLIGATLHAQPEPSQDPSLLRNNIRPRKDLTAARSPRASVARVAKTDGLHLREPQ